MVGRLPPQLKYIVGNEAAERFSWYGMSGLLTLFLVRQFDYAESDAEAVFHGFGFAVYFMPVFGAWIADRFWGKYPTIIRLSLIYVAGHAVLSLIPGAAGLYTGMALLAIGAGGIKPCVSAHAGDQLVEPDEALRRRLFGLFYVAINIGSMLAFLVTPWVKARWGYQAAFAVPGVLMALATVVFWMGRDLYVRVPPTGPRPDGPARVLLHVVLHGRPSAVARFGERPVTDALALPRIALVISPAIIFWALFFQTSSSWVLTSARMDLHGVLEPEMLQGANAGLIILMVPLFDALVYPWFERRGIAVTAVRRFAVGLLLTALAFAGMAGIQAILDDGGHLSSLWILGPYVLLTAGETLVSVTGLEYAYSQAPPGTKSTVQSIWYLTLAFGNLLVFVISYLDVFDGAGQFLFWASLMAAVALIFWLATRRYNPSM